MQKRRPEKLRPPPHLGEKKREKVPPHHQCTLSPKHTKQTIMYQNKSTIYGHLVTPFILVITNFMTPYFSINKLRPNLFGTPSIFKVGGL